MHILVLTLSISLPHLVPEALAGPTALPTADGWGETAAALPGESITVEVKADASTDAWAKSYIAQWECGAKQGIYFSGNEDPSVIEGLNKLNLDLCILANRILRREPGARIEHYERRAERLREILGKVTDPGRLNKLAHKATALLAEGWKIESLARQAFGEPCSPAPEALVLEFHDGRKATFPIVVDPNVCPQPRSR